MPTDDNAFRYRVEADLKYSLTFLFWWNVSEARARLQEARSALRGEHAQAQRSDEGNS